MRIRIKQIAVLVELCDRQLTHTSTVTVTPTCVAQCDQWAWPGDTDNMTALQPSHWADYMKYTRNQWRMKCTDNNDITPSTSPHPAVLLAHRCTASCTAGWNPLCSISDRTTHCWSWTRTAPYSWEPKYLWEKGMGEGKGFKIGTQEWETTLASNS